MSVLSRLSFAALALLAAHQANATCTIAPAKSLGALPFAGNVSSDSVQGFLFDDEGFDVFPGLSPLNMGNAVESSLRIVSLNIATGVFTGTVFGPWSGRSTSQTPVAGTITSSNNSYFAIHYTYTIPGKLRGSSTTYTFTGAINSRVVPETNTSACYPAMHVAGTFTVTARTLSAITGVMLTTSGPIPFSGSAFNISIPK